MREENVIAKHYWAVLLIGVLIGVVITTMLSLDSRVYEDPAVPLCGRGVAGECPSMCYDSETDTFLRFIRTDKNLNIIVERQRSAITTGHFIVTNYYVEDEYYYADIDDVIIT